MEGPGAYVGAGRLQQGTAESGGWDEGRTPRGVRIFNEGF